MQPVTADFSALASAQSYLCGIRPGDELHCWGIGQWGELGHGDAWRTSPTPTLP